ncbi:hypothetical protein CVT24_010382 [Panaeolus cyanescens]|uniref:Uncharacterized protein n=1 Tax=Panaeolus cyanescens TaxID=181874 RepID=A0A409YQ53_9AGAR|nr:hypothetical protein CVT24_010382 [Panaeolus cyanescens]
MSSTTANAHEHDVIHELDTLEGPKLDLTDEQKDNIRERIIAELSKGSARDIAIEEIKHLSQTISSIENDFATIKNSVKTIDDKNILFDPNTKQAAHFLPEWSACHDVFIALIRSTQGTAATARNELKTFIHDIIPIVMGTGDVQDKKDILNAYIKNIKKFQDAGEKDELGFLRLGQRINAFHMNITATITEDTTSIDKELETLSARITTLENDLARLKEYFDKYEPILHPHGISRSIRHIFYISPQRLAPLILGSAYSSSNIEQRTVERHSKQDELKKLSVDKETRTYQEPQLSIMMSNIVGLKSTFPHLTDRLNAIHGVWRFLDADALTLQQKLGSVNSALNASNTSFLMYTKGMLVAYDLFATMLETYCISVNMQ